MTYANHPDLARDFYQAEWQLGLMAAGQPDDAALYLTPTQEEMATIYFALQDPDRLRSFSEGGTLLPVGFAEQPILYLLRPDQTAALDRLGVLFPESDAGPFENGAIPVAVARDDARDWPVGLLPIAMGEGLRLTGWELTQAPESLQATLTWQATTAEARDLTMFVHIEDASGQVVAQTDRPPAGYPTTEWRPGEIVVDQVTVPLPPDLPPGTYTVTTGFYYLPTLERIGEPIPLGTLMIE